MRKLIFFTSLLVWLSICGIAVKVEAQSEVKQWDYLEVSNIRQYSTVDNKRFNYRSFYFYNFGTFDGKDSLEWIGKNGWELVSSSIYGGEFSGGQLIFKRPYNQLRTKKEIEDLKNAYELKSGQEPETKKQNAELIDLDVVDAKDNLAAFNKKDEERLGKILVQLNKPNIKVLQIKSSATRINESRIVAEFVVDGTSALLKDGNKYRVSEARKYLQEVGRDILNLSGLRFSVTGLYESGFQLGNLPPNGRQIGVSVIINYQGTQKVVAQGYVDFNWADNLKP